MSPRDKISDFISIFILLKDLWLTTYDLTNTYMEGEAASNSKAKHGRSKEKRTDCPLVTLALVLDSSAVVSYSKRKKDISPALS